ncbi:MAG: type II toxin-antitoxin system RelE/ParE family toxin [Lentisphaeria bacterium]|nr:type II toxin-antitoxin system RelE/ParE family toxin [Lentisphaeria bacterium]
MQYAIEITRRAQKQAMKIQQQDRVRIFAGIRNLSDSETWGDVRKLVNHEYGYRLRVGRYRVLFNATADLMIEVNEITVEEIRKRDDRTY